MILVILNIQGSIGKAHLVAHKSHILLKRKASESSVQITLKIREGQLSIGMHQVSPGHFRLNVSINSNHLRVLKG